MIVGACDSLSQANITDYALLGNASLHVFSRVSHFPNKEIPKELAAVILDFLEHGTSNPAKLLAQVSEKRKEITSKAKL